MNFYKKLQKRMKVKKSQSGGLKEILQCICENELLV